MNPGNRCKEGDIIEHKYRLDQALARIAPDTEQTTVGLRAFKGSKTPRHCWTRENGRVRRTGVGHEPEGWRVKTPTLAKRLNSSEVPPQTDQQRSVLREVRELLAGFEAELRWYICAVF